MGTWGTGIYSNDTASEVKDLCEEIFPFLSIEEANQIVFEEFKEIMASEEIDDDVASVWYALADWQWKHGILSEEIRLRTLELLSMHAGIEEWIESASKGVVKKRIAVMDKLKAQLETTMPAPKLPKRKLRKPKHKTGDIIILKIVNREENPEKDTWICKRGHIPFEYASKYIRESSMDFSNPMSAYSKYLAILCIGTQKELHSEYIRDIYDVDSVYVFYDYCNSKKPSLDDLENCGFLPYITHSYIQEERKAENIEWAYKFTTASDFRSKTSFGVERFEKVYSSEEVEKFHKRLEASGYSNKSEWRLELFHAFLDSYEEKVRLLNLGMEIDTLLDDGKVNPELLKEVIFRKY